MDQDTSGWHNAAPIMTFGEQHILMEGNLEDSITFTVPGTTGICRFDHYLRESVETQNTAEAHRRYKINSSYV